MELKHFPFGAGDKADVIIQAEAGEYKGLPQLSVVVKEMRPAGFDANDILGEYESYLRKSFTQSHAPDRDTIGQIYRVIQRRGDIPSTYETLYTQTENIGFCKICVALDILEELGLAQKSGAGYIITPNHGRAQLENSKIFTKLNEIAII
jgi:single-stranded-DNA-specific exonuclease